MKTKSTRTMFLIFPKTVELSTVRSLAVKTFDDAKIPYNPGFLHPALFLKKDGIYPAASLLIETDKKEFLIPIVEKINQLKLGETLTEIPINGYGEKTYCFFAHYNEGLSKAAEKLFEAAKEWEKLMIFPKMGIYQMSSNICYISGYLPLGDLKHFKGTNNIDRYTNWQYMIQQICRKAGCFTPSFAVTGITELKG